MPVLPRTSDAFDGTKAAIPARRPVEPLSSGPQTDGNRLAVGSRVVEVVDADIGGNPELLHSDLDVLVDLGLEHSPVEQHYTEIAVDFWNAALDAAPAFGAAAGDALQGFGWFSEVEPIDTRVWSQITLKTLTATGGRIDWAPRVAQRVAALAPSPTGLSILDQLVRGSPSDWERRKIAEQAQPVLASAQHLENAVEYRRLRAALIERGLLD